MSVPTLGAADAPRPVTILLSGAPGTGKSTVQRRAPAYFRSRLGATAAFGTDEIHAMIDPDWMLPYEQRRADFITQTCCHLAQQFFAADFRCVLIAGNALYTAETVEQYRQALTPFSYLYHITLDADLATLVERVRQRGDLTAHPPTWLAEWLAHIRGHYADWTHVIDTTNLSVEETLDVIYAQLLDSNHPPVVARAPRKQ